MSLTFREIETAGLEGVINRLMTPKFCDIFGMFLPFLDSNAVIVIRRLGL
jgi:hypothetical protein